MKLSDWMTDEQFLRTWSNRDGTFGLDHITLEELIAEANTCSDDCICWRHRMEAILAWQDEVFR